jgi:hypothetical protein
MYRLLALMASSVGQVVASCCLFASPVWAVDCSTGYIGLWSQIEVDNFQLEYGPCDRLLGLTIEGNDITNLDGLAGLSEVVSSLDIKNNAALNDLSGFSSLISVGRNLWIENNDALTTLDGLSALISVGHVLAIIYNGQLESLDGLSALVSTGGTLGIWENPRLENVNGLYSLVSVGASENSDQGWLHIKGNPSLTNLDGLDALVAVGNLRTLSGVLITDNHTLSQCTALARLVDPIDDPEPGPVGGKVPDVIGGQVSFHGNLTGCNSVAQILASVPLGNINAGLNDAWFNLDTDGQGFLIVVFPEIEQVFMAWFTYDTERPPADVVAFLQEPGHRWLTAQGGFEENLAALDVYIASGGIFDSPEPAPVREQDGEILLEFSTCNAGTVTYDIPSIDRQGVVPIERITLDNVALCYVLNIQAEPV